MKSSMRVPSVLAGIVAGVLVVAGVSPAAADETSDIHEIARLIEDVAPDQGKVLTPSTSRSGEFNVDGHSLPADAGSPVVVSGHPAKPLKVQLPTATASPGAIANDGTVVYSATRGAPDVAVQSLDSGAVRMQTVIGTAADSHEFRYGVGGGYVPVKADDGTFWAYAFDDEGELLMYGIDAAWARDANGVPVDTHYEVRGSALVQIVTPDENTTYPIVADPTWEWYNAAWGAGFSKAETRQLAASGGAAAFCTILPAPLPVVCGIFAASWFVAASQAAAAKGCVFISVVPAPIARRWISNKCK